MRRFTRLVKCQISNKIVKNPIRCLTVEKPLKDYSPLEYEDLHIYESANTLNKPNTPLNLNPISDEKNPLEYEFEAIKEPSKFSSVYNAESIKRENILNIPNNTEKDFDSMKISDMFYEFSKAIVMIFLLIVGGVFIIPGTIMLCLIGSRFLIDYFYKH